MAKEFKPTIELIVEELSHSELKERFYELHKQYEELKCECENFTNSTSNCNIPPVSNSVCDCDWNVQFKIWATKNMICAKCKKPMAN